MSSQPNQRAFQADRSLVAVFGSSQVPPGAPIYRKAREVGRRLATARLGVLNGGYGGVMAAASRGAKEGGGWTLGITTEAFVAREANPWLDEEIRVPTYFDRVRALLTRADGYILLPGGLGTLSELMLLWCLLQQRFLPLRPTILLGEEWRPLLEVVEGWMTVQTEDRNLLTLVDTPEQAVAEVVKALSATGVRPQSGEA